MLIEGKLWPCFLQSVCFSTPLLWLITLLLPTLMLNAKIHQHVANSHFDSRNSVRRDYVKYYNLLVSNTERILTV